MSTVQDQIDIINTALDAEASLAGLSTSQVAEWIALRNVVAAQHVTMREYFDTYKAELDVKAAEAIPGTAKWYADRAVEFQYGDSLTVVDGKVIYDPVDTEARIISIAAVTESVNGVVIIKVAKTSGYDLVKLSSPELTAFTTYIKDIKFAGTKTLIVSTDPDLVKLAATIYYDGKLLLADVKTAVEAAIEAHLKAIYFDGIFNRNLLRDAIEAVTGVKPGGVNITTLEIKPATGSYTSVTFSYTPISGYYDIDPTFPLSTQLTYTAQ